MVRAVFFDFYSVWAPDRFSDYLQAAEALGPEVFQEVYRATYRYFHGQANLTYLTEVLRLRLNQPGIDSQQFRLQETDIAPEIINFMRSLHAHFLKVGILANLGTQEHELLKNFNDRNQLFEVIASPLSFGSQAVLASNEIFAQAQQAVGEQAANCLYVSGNRNTLSFASSIGWQTLVFAGFPKLVKELAQRIASS